MLSAAGGLTRVPGTRLGLRVDFLASAALGLTVVGWALLWAAGLSILPLAPWIGAAVFVVGLLLIPFRWPRGSDPRSGR